MKRSKKWTSLILDAVCVTIGSLFYSVSINMFTTPNHISIGGFTGLATTLNYLWSFPVGITVFVLNIPLFLFSFRKLGRSFFIRTVIATGLVSLTLDLTAFLPELTDDKLLADIAGGVGTGIGLGLIFIRGCATGGSDLLAKLIQPFCRGISYGKIILIIDAGIIVIAGIAYKDAWSILYSALTIWISTGVIDAVQNGIDRAKSVRIITDRKEEIVNTIVKEMNRGASVWQVEGGYTGQPHTAVFVVVRRYELSHLKNIVREIDPSAFMIVEDATEVRGEGFRAENE